MKKLFLFIGLLVTNINCFCQLISDNEGNQYHTIIIGTQVWMLENLKVCHYNNGDSIFETQDSVAWVDQTKGAWCNFNNNPSNGTIYGRLYNGFAVNDARGIAPKGWHIPSDAEWQSLEQFLGMSNTLTNTIGWRGGDEGAKLKETDTTYWKWPTGNAATNSSGFSALGNGWRDHFNPPGYSSFVNLTNTGQWWTSTLKGSELYIRNLCVYHTDIYRISYPQSHGCAIRCIRDWPAGIEETKANLDIQIFPNIASDRLTIKSTNSELKYLKIYTMLGQKSMELNLSNGTTEISISELRNGVYYVVLYSEGNEILYSQKFIISR